MISLKSSGRMITNKLQDVTAVKMKTTEKRNNLNSKMQIIDAPPRSCKKRNKRILITATQ
jgi:hypothetical protein